MIGWPLADDGGDVVGGCCQEQKEEIYVNGNPFLLMMTVVATEKDIFKMHMNI